eukprot:scaffold23225_cov73-Isochrysis_galbana.AAC.1
MARGGGLFIGGRPIILVAPPWPAHLAAPSRSTRAIFGSSAPALTKPSHSGSGRVHSSASWRYAYSHPWRRR